MIGADPEGSVYSGGGGRPYLVEGVGEDFWPETFDRTICDEIIAVRDADSFALTRRLAREEGLLVGGSCGLAVAAALEVGRRAGPDDLIVVLLPDSGRAYLSRIFNDAWMTHYGGPEGGSSATPSEFPPRRPAPLYLPRAFEPQAGSFGAEFQPNENPFYADVPYDDLPVSPGTAFTTF